MLHFEMNEFVHVSLEGKVTVVKGKFISENLYIQNTAIMNKEVHYFGTIYINKNLGKKQAISLFTIQACLSLL
jgi:hypothetical protein